MENLSRQQPPPGPAGHKCLRLRVGADDSHTLTWRQRQRAPRVIEQGHSLTARVQRERVVLCAAHELRIGVVGLAFAKFIIINSKSIIDNTKSIIFKSH